MTRTAGIGVILIVLIQLGLMYCVSLLLLLLPYTCYRDAWVHSQEAKGEQDLCVPGERLSLHILVER